MEIASLFLLAVLAWLWLDSLKAREIGMQAARRACDAEGMQLLDDTVSIASIKPSRDDDGQMALRRVYEFEYSDTGDDRRRGSVVLLGHAVIVVNVGARPPPVSLSLY